MVKETQYEQRVSQYDRNDLLNLWKVIEAGDTSTWEAGKAFEYLVLRAFQLEGAEVRWPYRVTIGSEEIEQIDGFVYVEGLTCLIECKDQSEKVRIEPIAKLRNQLLRRPATTVGLVFSRNGFTEPAIILTQFLAPQTILLWDGDEVIFALQQARMRRALMDKYRYCAEHGLSDYFVRK